MNLSSLTRLSPSSVLLGLLLGMVFLWGCSTTDDSRPKHYEIRDAIMRGDFEEAMSLADSRKGSALDQEELQELHLVATVGYYLEEGRRATLADQDDEALIWFQRAEEISPDSERVLEWLSKTRAKLARTWVSKGLEALSSQEYSQAQQCYQQALEYEVANPLALAGLEQVEIQINYRIGLGESYYTEGIRALVDYRLSIARRGFEATTKYLPRMDRAVTRSSEVKTLLSEQRVEISKSFEEKGFYAGALSEVRIALALNPENEEAKNEIDRLKIENQAAQLLREAQMKIYRREFDAAIKLLDEGEALTLAQKEAFIKTRNTIDDAKLEAKYRLALDLEYDGQFEDSIKAYSDLLTIVDHYKDALARQATLEGYVEMAASYYEQAQNADDPAIKLEHLRSIEGFWPDYKNIRKLIDRLQ